MSHRLRCALAGAALAAAIAGSAGPCQAQAAPARSNDQAPTIDEVLQGAERLGGGRVTAWRRDGHSLLTLPPGVLGRPMVWYTEVVAVPAGVVASDGLEVNNTPVRLERRGAAVQVRDLGTVLRRRAAPAPPDPKRAPALTGAAPRDPKLRPIAYALGQTEAGALIATLPIVAESPDGTLLVDLTPAFGDDIPAATGRLIVAKAGVVPMGVDPAKTYIERVRARGEVVNIRTHLTFLAAVPSAQAAGPQPLSVVLGHSLVFLPEQPMRARPADPRVGYFPVEFTQFGGEQGAAQERRTLIQRFRLEKRDPAAAVSDPVKPITYYLGRGVPERWRPYLRAGVLQWLPAFEAAGFSNAIRVLDAPSPQDDPDWTEEDVTLNVIRWLPEERANAMGPRVVDPRSGETLSAHIQIWPSVIEVFGQYYWALFGGSGLDPAAARLPLSTERSGALLGYIVAHEVGHTLGLLHNQIASTAHPVASMRDPAFANRAGPNSSIMAYGRFNQVAQPGDGIRQFWSVLGPYDIAAIRYGYGSFGADPASEARELAAFADGFSRDRQLYFGSEESAAALARFGRDPRVQTENTGAERVLATRLGVANLLRSLARLDEATGGDAALYASAHAMLLDRHASLLKSVPRLVGGAEPALGPGGGPSVTVPAAHQREAVRYLLGEGARTLEAHTQPAVARRVAAFGMERRIRHLQAELVGELMNGPTVALLESQHLADATAYSPIAFGQDVIDALFGHMQEDSATRRALQRGWLEAARRLLGARADGAAAAEADTARQLQAQGLPQAAAEALAETGDDTEFVGWLQASLPALQQRLAGAARASRDASLRLYLQDMAAQVRRLAEAGL